MTASVNQTEYSVGLFKTDISVKVQGGTTTTQDTCGSDTEDTFGEVCSKIKATAAFVIIALFLFLMGIGLVFMRRLMMGALAFFLAGKI